MVAGHCEWFDGWFIWGCLKGGSLEVDWWVICWEWTGGCLVGGGLVGDLLGVGWWVLC